MDKLVLPSKYAEISLNNENFLLKCVHQNREILDNIHFKRASQVIKEAEVEDENEYEDEAEDEKEPVSRKKIKTKLKKGF